MVEPERPQIVQEDSPLKDYIEPNPGSSSNPIPSEPRTDTEESEPKSLSKYLQNKLYVATESSGENPEVSSPAQDPESTHPLSNSTDKIKIIEEEVVQKHSFDDKIQPGEDSDTDEEQFPVLFLDVNLGGGRIKRLIIKDGDDSMQIASQFCKENSKSWG